MSDSASSALGLRNQSRGSNVNLWGDPYLNTNQDLIGEAFGSVTISTTGLSGTQALTATNYVSNQARRFALYFTGTPAASLTYICPAVSKMYLVVNNTSGGFSITLKTAAGSGVAVAAGTAKLVFCDATNVIDSGLVTTATASAANLLGSSSSSVSVGAGSKSFTLAEASARAWVANATVLRFSDASNPANYIQGPITSYSHPSITIDAQTSGGSGTITSWVAAVAGSSFAVIGSLYGGATDTSSAVDVSLTSGSTRVQSVTMTAAAKKVTLPDATTLTAGEGGPWFRIVNAGQYGFSVRSSGGAFLCYLPPRAVVECWLRDNSSAAGVWSLNGQGIAFANYGAATVFEAAEADFICIAPLSATAAVCCYADAGNSNNGTAVILTLDTATLAVTAGTPAVFEAADTDDISVCALSATKALACYSDAGNSDRGTAVILDISGTTITPGTPAVFDTDAVGVTKVCALSATKALAVYNDTTNTDVDAVVLDVSGSTITPATAVQVSTSVASNNSLNIAMLTATTAFVQYNTSGVVLSVATSTITVNTPITLPVSSNSNEFNQVIATDSDQVLLVGGYNSTSMFIDIGVVSVSSVTLTAQARTYRIDDPRRFVGGFMAKLGAGRAVMVGQWNNVAFAALAQVIVDDAHRITFDGIDGGPQRNAVPADQEVGVCALTGGINILVAFSDAGNSNHGTVIGMEIGG